MSRTTITIRKYVMRTHRWMGVGFCWLFLVWFTSGIVMMYCRFPGVDAKDRLSHAAALDPGRIHITPDQAFAALHASGAPSQIRLNLIDGRPLYRFGFGRRVRLVSADDGEPLDRIPRDMAVRIAAAWTHLPPSRASCQELQEADQWTIDPSVAPYGPFWKCSWPGGEETYVSESTGELLQDTTPASRLGAWFGPIPHWLYFTALRRNASLWSSVVMCLSGAGAVMSILGLIAGVWLYSPAKRYQSPRGRSSIPFLGPKRWHVRLGLIFGAITCTWVFSGLLSLGPFSWLRDRTSPNLDRALRPDRLDVARFRIKDPRQAISEAGATLEVRELDFASFAGDPLYIARQTPQESRIVPMQGVPKKTLDSDQIIQAVQHAVAPAAVVRARVVNKYEPYYVDRHKELPLPVLYVELGDANRSAYYIDPRNGEVVQAYGVRSRWERWLYHGLHSFDLPWLYARRPLWDILVIALLLGGTALSSTALWIACKLLRRKLSGRRKASRRSPDTRVGTA